MLTDRGILVKANSVLIPGVNDKEVANVSKKIKRVKLSFYTILCHFYQNLSLVHIMD